MSRDFSKKSDAEIRSWIENHERKGATKDPLYLESVQEYARRKGHGLNTEVSLEHLIRCAKNNVFTTYGDVAAANDVPWNEARHLMNGSGGHLDQLLSICHARDLPLFPAICVNQGGVQTGHLDSGALEGFKNGAKRLGIPVTDAAAFLEKCQNECFQWGRKNQG